MYASELALMCKAINQGWAIGDDERSVVVRRLMEVLQDSESSRRDITRAATALASLDKLKLAAAVASKSIVSEAPPTVIIHQAPADDPVRRMIENANEQQLSVIAELLRADAKNGCESTASRNPPAETVI